MKLRQKLERFMYGRNGTDTLGIVFLGVSLTLMIVNSFINNWILYILELLFLGYYFFRFFSRNTYKRYQENQKFERFFKKMVTFFKLRRTMWIDRKTHVFTKCPHCKVNLRLPKKKGNHTVRCPKCHQSFDFKCK